MALENAAQVAEGFKLNLTHTFARKLEALCQFLKRQQLTLIDAIAMADDKTLLGTEHLDPVAHQAFDLRQMDLHLGRDGVFVGQRLTDGEARIDIKRCIE